MLGLRVQHVDGHLVAMADRAPDGYVTDRPIGRGQPEPLGDLRRTAAAGTRNDGQHWLLQADADQLARVAARTHRAAVVAAAMIAGRRADLSMPTSWMLGVRRPSLESGIQASAARTWNRRRIPAPATTPRPAAGAARGQPWCRLGARPELRSRCRPPARDCPSGAPLHQLDLVVPCGHAGAGPHSW